MLRRLPENEVPDCAEFFLAFKARSPAHSELCNGLRNEEGGQEDKQEGMSFDRNRLSAQGLGAEALSQQRQEDGWIFEVWDEFV